MVLESLDVLPVQPRGGGRRRLIIDKEIIIPAELFRAQLYDCKDLLRVSTYYDGRFRLNV